MHRNPYLLTLFSVLTLSLFTNMSAQGSKPHHHHTYSMDNINIYHKETKKNYRNVYNEFKKKYANDLIQDSHPPFDSTDDNKWHHPLNLDNNDYWKKRATIEVTKNSNRDIYDKFRYTYVKVEDIEPSQLQNNQIPFDPTCNVQEIRICTKQGMELQWACFREETRITKGALKKNDILTFPVSMDDFENNIDTATYFIYYDNNNAGTVMEPRSITYNTISNHLLPTGYNVRYKDFKFIALEKNGHDVEWPIIYDLWEYRIPIKVFNFSSQPQNNKLVAINLSRIASQFGYKLNKESIRIVDFNPDNNSFSQLTFYSIEQLTTFFISIPAKTEKTLYVYFSEKDAVAGSNSEKNYKDFYTNLFIQSRNLIKNPSFEKFTTDGKNLPSDWMAVGNINASFLISKDSEGFSDNCVQSDIHNSPVTSYYGWKQNIENIYPASYYLFIGMFKAKRNDSFASKPLPFASEYYKKKDLSGNLPKCKYKHYIETSSSIYAKDSNWQIDASILSTPADANTLTIQSCVKITPEITKTTSLWHDAFFLAETMCGYTGEIEFNDNYFTSAMALWQVNAIRKIFPDTKPESTSPIEAFLAGNEKENIQLAIWSKDELDNVQVRVSTLSLNDNVLPNIKTNLIGYVPVDYSSGNVTVSGLIKPWQRPFPGASDGAVVPAQLMSDVNDGWIGTWPDPLYPNQSFNLDAGKTQGLLLTIDAPKGTPPGIYTGTIEILRGNAVIRSTELSVKVWGFNLPSMQDDNLTVVFDFYLRDNHKASLEKFGYNFEVESIYDSVFQLLKTNRITANRPPSWPYYYPDIDSNDYKNYPSDISFFLGKDGYNFQTCYTPWVFSIGQHRFGNKSIQEGQFHINPFNNKNDSTAENISTAFDKTYKQSLKQFYQKIIGANKGWEHRFIHYLMDEPYVWENNTINAIKHMSGLIREVDNDSTLSNVDIPIFVSTRWFEPELLPYIDIWGIRHHDAVDKKSLMDILSYEASGKIKNKIWYTMDNEYCLDTPLLGTERMLPYLCFKHGATGYEYYDVLDISVDPNIYGSHPAKFNPVGEGGWWGRYENGNGFVMYPYKTTDGNSILCSSIRLEQLREGIEDYEYLHMLRKLHETCSDNELKNSAYYLLEEAKDIVSIPNKTGIYSTTICPNPEAVLELKEDIGNLIEAISRLPKYPDWINSTDYFHEDIVNYNGQFWKCVFNHTSQNNWAPGSTGIWFWEVYTE